MHKYLRYRSIFSLFLLFKLQICTVIPLWNRWWRKEKKMVTLDSSRGKKISGVNSSTLIHIHIYLIWMFIMSTLDGYFALPVLPVVLWTLFYGYFMHTQNYDTVRFTRYRCGIYILQIFVFVSHKLYFWRFLLLLFNEC